MRSDMIKTGNGRIELPTVGECLEHYGEKYFYVEGGIERYYTESTLPSSDVQKILRNTRVLPINSDPTREDSDGDGLYDGKTREDSRGNVIAPIDPAPLSYSGKKNLWNRYIGEMTTKTIPNHLEGWHTFDPSTFKTLPIWVDNFLSSNYSNCESLYDVYRRTINNLQEITFDSVHKAILSLVRNEEFTTIGSRLLMFREDNGSHTLHSQTNADISEYLSQYIRDTNGLALNEPIEEKLNNMILEWLMGNLDMWQKPFGYNDLYDIVFKWGTRDNMDRAKFEFNADGRDYILWMWRGDYLNLGSGSEIGVYRKFNENDIDTPSFLDPAVKWIADNNDYHWSCIDFEIPMTLNLYRQNSVGDYDTIYNWAPDNPQWWITGFNPDFMAPDVHDLYMIGTIDFSEFRELFESLKNQYRLGKLNNIHKWDYMYIDESSQTVWIMWGDNI